MVRVSGLALVGQVAIGLRGDHALATASVERCRGRMAYLNAVLEAVELQRQDVLCQRTSR